MDNAKCIKSENINGLKVKWMHYKRENAYWIEIDHYKIGESIPYGEESMAEHTYCAVISTIRFMSSIKKENPQQ